MEYSDLFSFGIAIGLGFIVGIQRETADKEIAGVRTFTFIAMLGALAGIISRETEQYYLISVFALALIGLTGIANFIKFKKDGSLDVGMTTEVAILLMYGVGCYVVIGDQLLAVIIGAVLAILLHIKDRLHNTIERMEKKDINAIMTFVGISLIVLPILPDQYFGPQDVLNPKEIWLIVVLIVGISVAGYFLYKLLGTKVGVISNGVLGGLISSTATTVSYSRFAKESAKIAKLAAFVIMTASTISFIRVVVEVGVVIPNYLPKMMLPFLVLIVVMLILCAGLYIMISKQKTKQQAPEPENPAQFKSALVFGLLYGLILLIVAFTKAKLGNNALFIVAIISGLTDVDAITLSLSKLIQGGSLQTHYGWQLMMLAGLSNMAFKGGMAFFLGGNKLFKWIAITFGATIIAGALIMWLWPESWQLHEWEWLNELFAEN